MFANRSFYQGMHVFSGITFGAFQFASMQYSLQRLDVLIFFALSLSPLLFLFALKNKLESAGVKTYELARPYRHILADFLFFTSVAASLSALVFIYTRGLRLVDNDLLLPGHTLILITNLVFFSVAMGLYSLLAKEERRALEGGKP